MKSRPILREDVWLLECKSDRSDIPELELAERLYIEAREEFLEAVESENQLLSTVPVQPSAKSAMLDKAQKKANEKLNAFNRAAKVYRESLQKYKGPK